VPLSCGGNTVQRVNRGRLGCEPRLPNEIQGIAAQRHSGAEGIDSKKVTIDDARYPSARSDPWREDMVFQRMSWRRARA